MTYRYLVIIEKTATGYSAYSPDVQGCVATAKTSDAAQAAMNEAIEFHLEGLIEGGEPVPQPRATHSFAVIKPDKLRTESSQHAYHILPSEGGWVVKRTGASRASRIHADKNSAITYAKTLADKGSGKVLIHNKDGSVRSVDRHTQRSSSKNRGKNR